MQIGMADPAVKNIDENVLRAKITALEIKRSAEVGLCAA